MTVTEQLKASGSTRQVGQRTMVVWVPDWPVLAAASVEGVSPSAALAVLQKGRVLASSAAARAEGVRRGLRARDAQSRCPDLLVLKYDPVVDARAFDPVISCLEALTPGIQVIRPGMCALKARGPSRYYGSEPAAAEKLLDRLETYDVPGGRVGVADGPFAAEQAARAASAQTRVRVIPPGGSAEFLAPLTIDTLERPELTDLLRRLGLRSLGAFARLPATEVLTRFGPDGAFAHRLARGDDDRAVVAREVPPELTRTLDFEPPVDRVDQVAFAVRTVAEELVGRLAALGLVCTTLRVEVGTESGRVHEREWLHPRWFAPGDVVDRVRWQLQGSGTATSELTSPVVRLRLVPERVDPVGAHVDTLWGSGPDERIHRALSRVQSMLGHGAVVTPVISGGRGYAERQTLIPWGDPLTPARPPSDPWPGSLPAPTSPPTPVPDDSFSGLSTQTAASLAAISPPVSSVPVLRTEHVIGGLQVFSPSSSESTAPSASRQESSATVSRRPRTTTPLPLPSTSGWPVPVPTLVYPSPRPAEVLAADGRQVTVSARGGLSGAPAAFRLLPGPQVADSNKLHPVTAWAGPWPVEERWWDEEAENRLARFQLVTADGRAWLAAVQNTHWWIEASYD
ncbi:DNA polymerase [Kribbella sp. ALI-6-A]|uniref:DNA polymerase Y family protein n=1 Tax=Kribbella sp. ALI-6-A TaxID=1933817 RepID=UPI00097BD1DD|nr:DNA polymerase Y family protein [Kribbella sp. ALI-6-A]ONI69468.1 DNA polymerase [Kribbella sp. ALI-6-A]